MEIDVLKDLKTFSNQKKHQKKPTLNDTEYGINQTELLRQSKRNFEDDKYQTTDEAHQWCVKEEVLDEDKMNNENLH